MKRFVKILFLLVLSAAITLSCKPTKKHNAEDVANSPVQEPQETDIPTAVLDSSGFQEIIKGQIPVLADFTAVWCKPCQMMKPFMERLAGEYKSKIRFQAVDVDRNPGVARQYGIEYMPTLVLFSNGKEIWRNVGYLDEQQVRTNLDQQVSNLK